MKLGRQRNYHKGRAAIRQYANQPANLRIAFVSSSNLNGRCPGCGDVGEHGVLEADGPGVEQQLLLVEGQGVEAGV